MQPTYRLARSSGAVSEDADAVRALKTKEMIAIESVFPRLKQLSSYTRDELIELEAEFRTGIEELEAMDAKLVVEAEVLEEAKVAGTFDADVVDVELGRIESEREEIASRIKAGSASIAAITLGIVLERF